MLKTISHNVFEVNCNNTYSFTIERVDFTNIFLVKEETLNYSALDKIVIRVNSGGWILICNTYEEKFSFIVYTVLNLNCSVNIKRDLMRILKEKCKYKLIFTDINPTFEMYDEVHGNPFDSCKELIDYQSILCDLINKAEDKTTIFKEIHTI